MSPKSYSLFRSGDGTETGPWAARVSHGCQPSMPSDHGGSRGPAGACGTGFRSAGRLMRRAPTHTALVRDLNGDTFVDLAVANAESNSISVLLGNGSGGFSAAVNYEVGWQPKFVTSGDLNGDTFPDLVTANQSAHTVSVLINLGERDLRCSGTLCRPGGNARCDAGQLRWRRRSGHCRGRLQRGRGVRDFDQGNGTFANPVDYAVGSGPHSVIAADFGGDSKPDLAIANNSSNDIAVLINNGNGTFAPRILYPVARAPTPSAPATSTATARTTSRPPTIGPATPVCSSTRLGWFRGGSQLRDRPDAQGGSPRRRQPRRSSGPPHREHRRQLPHRQQSRRQPDQRLHQ